MNADEVDKNLWVGGVQTDPEFVDKNFDVLVLCAKEFIDSFPVHLYPGTEVVLAPLVDPGKPTAEEKYDALKAGLTVRLRLNDGKKVLVTCAKGVNRSSLVAAIAMIIDGKSAEEAISTIQKKRKPPSKAVPLFNPYFVKLVHELDEALNSRTQKHQHAVAQYCPMQV